jgi:beta-lactamase regulating signal transducer with metallopeptidase domain
MNQATSLLQSEWMKALGWTFVHSLWQIALVGLLLFVILRLIPGRSAHVRYTISTMALWLVLVLALATFIIMLPDTQIVTEVTGKLLLLGQTAPITLADKISAWLETRMPMMLTIWSGGVAILMIRLAISLFWVRHIRQTAIPEEDLQSLLNQLIKNLRISAKPGASSTSLISSPVTIGHLKPVILFPIAIINQLTPLEVEAILTHELAHIVRRDYLSNLIQSFIETLFYYHPVTWWISGMVRTERENRADDLAISWCGDHLAYAKALMTVQEMQVRHTPSLTIGFSSRKGAMLARIQRILNLPYKNHNQMEKTVLLSLSTLCFLAFTLTSHTNPEQAASVSQQQLTTISLTAETTDSIPAEGIYRLHKKTDDQEITIEVENGDIKELKIDGKEIQPSEFEAYNEVIDDLFGSIEAPPSMEGFDFVFPEIPHIPEMPMIPGMPYMIDGLEFEFPEIPDMPGIPGIPYSHQMQRVYLDEFKDHWNENGGTITIYNPEIMGGGLNITHDTTIINGQSTIIIKMDGGDSSVICIPGHQMWSGDVPSPISIDGQFMNEEEMKKWTMEMERNAQLQGKEWRAQVEQWREQQNEWREQWRAQTDQEHAEQQRLRGMERNQYRWTDDHQQAIERELRQLEELKDIYVIGMPRLSLSEEMVKDGLIEPGDEAEIQLTPDKMKINGEKMPEAIHQKYLELYEQQQGVELSGNSKVEFTTKSKQRM